MTVLHSQKDVPKTIEGTLFNALVRAGAVSEDNADAAAKVCASFRTYALPLTTIYRCHSAVQHAQTQASTLQGIWSV